MLNPDKNKYYRNPRNDLREFIPKNAKKVLDVGCAEGLFGASLKKMGAEKVVGIEINPEIAERANKVLDEVVVGDVENVFLDFQNAFFDCIIFGDILEHLIDPWQVLIKMKKFLHDDGCVIASVPNVRFWKTLLPLIFGSWDYKESGVLDRTHLRFFTLKSIKKTFKGCGYKISKIGFNMGIRTKVLNFLSFGILKEFLVEQIYIVARKIT